jgi:hypothetical protein
MSTLFPRLRRNPTNRLDTVIDAIRSIDPRLAELMAKYPNTVTPFLAQIEAKLRSKGLLTTTDAITDREAWRRLANLVPSALRNEAEGFKNALVAEFEAEARKAG